MASTIEDAVAAIGMRKKYTSDYSALRIRPILHLIIAMASLKLAESNGRKEVQKIRIVIADDHAVLRESLAALLDTQNDFQVEGTASDGVQALELVQKFHPDVLVLDLFMPNSDGFEVLRTLDKASNRVATVILTGSENEADYTNVVRMGGRGLVLKSDGPEKLFAAVRTVAAGELAFSDDLAQRVLSSMVRETKSQPAGVM